MKVLNNLIMLACMAIGRLDCITCLQQHRTSKPHVLRSSSCTSAVAACNYPCGRRAYLAKSAALISVAAAFPKQCEAISSVNIVGNDCNGLTCLGVANGILADCDSTSCVSSQDDAAGGGFCFAEPWEYDDGSLDQNFKALKSAVLDRGIGLAPDEVVELVASAEEDPNYRYLRVSYVGLKSGFRDDAEWYLPANDVTIQFRSARRGGLPDFGANKKRMEELRKALRLQKIPVVRNRRRAFIFGESPFDTFGPATGGAADDDPQGFLDRMEGAPSRRDGEGRKANLDIDPLSAPALAPSKALRQLKNQNEALQADDFVLLPFRKGP